MFKTILGKAFLGVFIASLIITVAAGVLYWMEQEKTATLSKNLSTMEVKLQAAEKAASLRKESGKIDGEALGEKASGVEKVYVEKLVVDNKTAKLLDEVNKKYAAKEKTAENEAAEQLEVSSIRINSLWASYCNAIAGTKDCPSNLNGDTP